MTDPRPRVTKKIGNAQQRSVVSVDASPRSEVIRSMRMSPSASTDRVSWRWNGSDQEDGSAQVRRTLRVIGKRPEDSRDRRSDEQEWYRRYAGRRWWQRGGRARDTSLVCQLPGRAALIGRDLIGTAVFRVQATRHPILRRQLPASAMDLREVACEQYRDSRGGSETADHPSDHAIGFQECQRPSGPTFRELGGLPLRVRVEDLL